LNTPVIIFILTLLLPVFSGFVTYMLRGNRWAFYVPVIVLIVTLGLSAVLLHQVSEDVSYHTFQWLPGYVLGWRFDVIGISLIMLVGLISLLVHIFSLKYMEDEPGKGRYYFKLGLFTSSMIGLLAADHVLLLFVFWELVGFSSYLLIGYWYQDPSKSNAGRIAFMTNRIADTGLLAGILLIMVNGSGLLSELSWDLSEPWVFWASFCLLIGALGKSAQFPFFTWLPRAMAGPTPVSALIHAATMVAAGVYLLIRVAPLFPQSIAYLTAFIGGFSALIAAIAAIYQYDIKSVLAYSTISQLGYMVMATGFGAVDMAMFHLWTHAFFKAGLFLAAGAVIHYLHKQSPDVDAQDMRHMGGFRRLMPFTSLVFLICMLSLAGLPLLSGFMSKEGILIACFEWASHEPSLFKWFILSMGLITVMLTAFYMTRQLMIVFYGNNRLSLATKGSESLFLVKIPLGILALGSMGFFYDLNPFSHEVGLLSFWFEKSSGSGPFWLTLGSVTLVAGGLVLGRILYNKHNIRNYQPNTLFSSVAYHGFGLDRFYMVALNKSFLFLSYLVSSVDRKIIDPFLNWLGIGVVVGSKLIDILDKVIVDGIVNGLAWLSAFFGNFIRLFQAVRVQLHVFWALVGVIIILIWISIF
jgi:NADH-quinone oxidoreductase subunit L